MDLTSKEAEAGLWLIRTVALAYSTEAPDGSVLDSLKRKLMRELNQARQLERHREAGVSPEIVRQGVGW